METAETLYAYGLLAVIGVALTMATLASIRTMIAALELNIRWNRVGGLLFWRIGRLGGSFYIARS